MTATLTPRTTTRFDQVDLDESGPNGATAPGHTEALDPKPTPRAGGLTLEQSEAFGAAMADQGFFQQVKYALAELKEARE